MLTYEQLSEDQRRGTLGAMVLFASDRDDILRALKDVPGVGPKMANSVADYVEESRAMLWRLLELGVVVSQAP